MARARVGPMPGKRVSDDQLATLGFMRSVNSVALADCPLFPRTTCGLMFRLIIVASTASRSNSNPVRQRHALRSAGETICGACLPINWFVCPYFYLAAVLDVARVVVWSAALLQPFTHTIEIIQAVKVDDDLAAMAFPPGGLDRDLGPD